MTMQLFDLAAIAVPVLLTYGVEDVAAPVGQGRWLAAHIPTVEVWETAGTFRLIDLHGDDLAGLLQRARPQSWRPCQRGLHQGFRISVSPDS